MREMLGCGVLSESSNTDMVCINRTVALSISVLDTEITSWSCLTYWFYIYYMSMK